MERSSQYLSVAVLALCSGLFAAQAHATTRCDVTLSIDTSSSGALSHVEVQADYSSASGTFEGTGSSVACVALTSDTSQIYQDTCGPSDNYCYAGGERMLRAILSRSAGFDGSVSIATCSFVAPAGQAPTASAFAVTVRGATNIAGDEVATLPSAEISGIQCGE